MSGLGRRTHYRKHLTDSVLYDYPEPAANECIAKIMATRGSNQFDIRIAKQSGHHPNNKNTNNDTEVINEPIDQGIANNTTSEGGTELAILPTKFRKLIWLKRNDFVIVQYATDESNDINTTHSNNNNNNEIHHRMEASQSSTDNIKIDNSNGNVASDDIRKTAGTKNSMGSGGGGIRYMITHILYKNQIQHLKTAGLWPTSDPNFQEITSTTMTANGDMSTATSTTDSDGIVFTKHQSDVKHVNYHGDDDNDDDVGSDDNSDYDEEATDDDNDDDLFINTNRMAKIELQDSD